jgi:hypothetical protein
MLTSDLMIRLVREMRAEIGRMLDTAADRGGLAICPIPDLSL